jgi:hypothetical protein
MMIPLSSGRFRKADHFNALPAKQADRRLAPVDHEEAVDILLREHLVEGCRVELGVAAVQERGDGLRRL